MTLLSQLPGIAAVAAWLVLVAGLALAVRARWPERREWSRKLVHIGSGAVVPIAWALQVERGLAVAAAALITGLALLNHRLRLLPAVEDVGRASYGTVAYGASITLLLWWFWPTRADAVAAAVLVMAVGDGLAGLVGPLRDSPSWQVLGQRRSLLGTGVMAMASLAVLLLVAAAAGPERAPSALALAGLALAATMLEQLGPLGIDNLSVPLLVGWLWAQLGATP